MLANESTRSATVAKLAASGKGRIPLLISWTRNPPAQVDKLKLYVGLADTFGQLKATEAIPFLISNISLRRWAFDGPNTWLKTPAVVKERLPCILALIQIGPEASRALMNAYPHGMMDEDRLAAIFVISRIKGVPEARSFLLSVSGQINLERHLLEDGLNLRNQ